MGINVVVLDLGKIPGITVHNSREPFGGIVVGEADVPDLALLLLLAAEVIEALFQHLVEPCLAQGMEQIEIDVVGFQTHQLFLEIRFGFHQPDRHFGSQEEAVPGIPAQSFAYKRLGSTAEIGPGGIIVVDAMLIGIIKHGKGLLPVDGIAFHRQTHTAESQLGHFNTQTVQFGHFHAQSFLSELWITSA